MQTSSSSSGSTSNANSPQCGDLYFDDEFGSERIMSRDRHLRLQTTLGLDRPASINLSDEFRSPVTVRGTGRAKTQCKVPGHKAAAGDPAASGRQTKCARAVGEGTYWDCACDGFFNSHLIVWTRDVKLYLHLWSYDLTVLHRWYYYYYY